MTPHVTTLVGVVVPMFDLNPFHWAGDAAKSALADAFTSAMMALWSAGLWLIDASFKIIDTFLTPNVQDAGLGGLYSITLWLSLLVALVVGLGQIGMVAIRRDGRSIATLAAGIVQYGAVVSCWLVICGAVIYACAGLTKTLLDTLLHVDGFAGYSASAGMQVQATGTVQAAILGVCALFMLIPASFGYIVIMLVREAALIILTATMPIAAAGALGETSRAWMWKSIRWFLATSLMSPLLALVVGIGVQISRAAFPDTTGSSAHGLAQPSISRHLTTHGPAHLSLSRVSDAVVAACTSGGGQHGQHLGSCAQHWASDGQGHVGMAVVGCVVFLIACFCPMVLFRLLAFVDPGTASGASFRATMAANGGVSGLLSRSRSGEASEGSGTATQAAGDGRSASESSADAETANRWQSRAAKVLPALGRTVAGTIDTVGSVAQRGASLSVDVLGQSGVGHQGYYDTTPPPRTAQAGHHQPQRTRVGHGWDNPGPGWDDPGADGGGVANDPHPPNPMPPPMPADGGGIAEAAGEDGAFLA
jgi:hypothetical protein